MLSESSAAQKYIARQLSGNYADIDSRVNGNHKFNRRAFVNLRKAEAVQTGLGTAQAIFGPSDVITLFGLTYTYTGGSQNYKFRDSSGNLTENEDLVDVIEIESVNLKYTISDGIDVISGAANGKLILEGFHLGTSYRIKQQNLTFSGLINGFDQITMTTNSNITINQKSFPFPVKGSSESGTVIFNGHQYSFSASYNGTNVATVQFHGKESITTGVNMATGVLVDAPEENVNGETDGSSSDDASLSDRYPAIVQSYDALAENMSNNFVDPGIRINNIMEYISTNFRNMGGDADKYSDFRDITLARMERYNFNKYSFTLGDYSVIDENTLRVITTLVVNVIKKPDQVGIAPENTDIYLENISITWKNESGTWRIVQGLPYTSSEYWGLSD